MPDLFAGIDLSRGQWTAAIVVLLGVVLLCGFVLLDGR